MDLNKFTYSTTGKLLITVAVSTVLYMLSSFLLPILLSIALAFLLYPITLFARRIPVGPGKYHPTRVMAIVLSFMFLGVLCVFLVNMFLLPLFEQINALAEQLPEVSGRLEGESLRAFIQNTKSKLPQLPGSVSALVDEVIIWAVSFLSDVANHLVKSTLEILSNLFGMVVVPFLAFYFLKDWRILKTMIVNMFNVRQRDKVNQVLDKIGVALSGYTMGLGKMCLMSGTVVTIMLLVMGVRYPLVFGFLAFLAEAVPVIGPVIAAVPAIFMAYMRDPNLALMLMLFYIIYYTIDGQLLMPYVMGQTVSLHPVVIIIALMIGARLFGAVGMLFAVPVAAVYRVLYSELWHYNGFEPLNAERRYNTTDNICTEKENCYAAECAGESEKKND